MFKRYGVAFGLGLGVGLVVGATGVGLAFKTPKAQAGDRVMLSSERTLPSAPKVVNAPAPHGVVAIPLGDPAGEVKHYLNTVQRLEARTGL